MYVKDLMSSRPDEQLYHLLSFTSGYSRDGIASPACSLAPVATRFMTCAESLYNHSETDTYEPGKHWAYLTSHLQARATKRSSQDSSHTTYVQAQPIGQPPQALLALPAPPPPAPAAEAEVHSHGDHMLA